MSGINTSQEININEPVIALSNFPVKRNTNDELITSRVELAEILRKNGVGQSTKRVKEVLGILEEGSDYRKGKGYCSAIILSNTGLENFIRTINGKALNLCEQI